VQTTSITDVHTIGINVSDQEEAIKFYVGTLGFDKRLDAPISPTMRWIEVAPPGATTSIALIAGEDAPSVGGETGIRFTVPDADAEHATLAERGIHVSNILRWEGVPPMFSFNDPDGNRFDIIEASQ